VTVEEFRLPDVGEGIAEAEIVSWYVDIGEPVQRDQPLVEIETDKALVDIPAPCSGILRYQGAPPGTTLPVGAVLAKIEPISTSAGGGAEATSAPTTGSVSAGGPAADTPEVQRRPIERRRTLASPATRRLAHRLQVDLTEVTGTGPGGRITEADVRQAAQRRAHSQPSPDEPATQSAPAPQDPPSATAGQAVPQRSAATAADEVVNLRGVRRQISRAMAAASQVPTIYEWRDVDASALMRAVESFRRHHNAGAPRVDLMTLMARAVAVAVRTHRRMNATFDPETDRVTMRGGCDLGIATATEDGLIVPVVRNADRLSVAELAAAIADVTHRARQRTLRPDETSGGSITISNFGSLGTRYGSPLLRVPEVAIVGVGRVADQVMAVEGRPEVRPVLPLSVATDHRVNDGAHLAAFCSTLEQLLADPVLLLAGL